MASLLIAAGGHPTLGADASEGTNAPAADTAPDPTAAVAVEAQDPGQPGGASDSVDVNEAPVVAPVLTPPTSSLASRLIKLSPSVSSNLPPQATEPQETESPVPAKRDVTSPGNPYRPIVARNAFRLREPAPPPPPPTNPPAAPEPAKIDVKLAGLAKIKGVRYAYLMVPDASRPGQFLYPSLTDDPAHGRIRHGSGLEVKEIDMKKGTVRVVNGGVEATLNFKDNGLKKDSVPGTNPASKPGTPPTPGKPTTANVLNRAATTTQVFPAGGGAMPQPADTTPANEPMVFSRNPNRATANNFNPAAGGGNPTFNAGAGSLPGGVNSNPNIPNRVVRTDSPALNIPSVPIEQQYDLLIRQRQAAESIGIRLPPIPGMPEPVPTQ